MSQAANTTIRMFGTLHTFRRDRGLDPQARVVIPPEGKSAREVARSLGLPLEKIEAVFVNYRIYPLDRIIMPGDAVALVPTCIPGPSRVLLGIFGAGRDRRA